MNAPKDTSSSGGTTLALSLSRALDLCFNWTIYGPGRTLIYALGWLFLALTALAVYHGLEVGVFVVVLIYFFMIHVLLEIMYRSKRK